jgi:ATP-dependent protease ClpP protease subunit
MMMNRQRVYISFVRPINWDTVNPLLDTCNQAINDGARQLYLLLSSPGGDVDPGVAVYNQLLGLPADIITHNTGCIDSIANVIFLAGSQRLACPNSTFLFHGVHWDLSDAVELWRPQLMEITSSLQAAENKMRDIIVNRSNLSKEDVDAFFAEGATKDAAFALSKGIINAIEDINIPQGAHIFQT